MRYSLNRCIVNCIVEPDSAAPFTNHIWPVEPAKPLG